MFFASASHMTKDNQCHGVTAPRLTETMYSYCTHRDTTFTSPDQRSDQRQHQCSSSSQQSKSLSTISLRLLRDSCHMCPLVQQTSYYKIWKRQLFAHEVFDCLHYYQHACYSEFSILNARPNQSCKSATGYLSSWLLRTFSLDECSKSTTGNKICTAGNSQLVDKEKR